MIGKFCAKASFCIVYIHSAEIYPTPVRSIGMGISSMASRVGGILSPLITVLGDYWLPLPSIIIGCFAVLAGLLALLLPETRGKNLPETIEEGEMFGKKIASNSNGAININIAKENGKPSSHDEGTDNPAFENNKV
ncbi:organic cation transporter protein-like [Amphiura filiformis]|uniref:organic cation transporter protein-like n=1 Tax=Amphiura filiformis TaxID=82378 RepID=UPI003B21AD5E